MGLHVHKQLLEHTHTYKSSILPRPTYLPIHHQSQATIQGAATVPELKKVRRQRDKAYTELGQRLDRSVKMRSVLDRMQVEKNVMVGR